MDLKEMGSKNDGLGANGRLVLTHLSIQVLCYLDAESIWSLCLALPELEEDSVFNRAVMNNIWATTSMYDIRIFMDRFPEKFPQIITEYYGAANKEKVIKIYDQIHKSFKKDIKTMLFDYTQSIIKYHVGETVCEQYLEPLYNDNPTSPYLWLSSQENKKGTMQQNRLKIQDKAEELSHLRTYLHHHVVGDKSFKDEIKDGTRLNFCTTLNIYVSVPLPPWVPDNEFNRRRHADHGNDEFLICIHLIHETDTSELAMTLENFIKENFKDNNGSLEEPIVQVDFLFLFYLWQKNNKKF